MKRIILIVAVMALMMGGTALAMPIQMDEGALRREASRLAFDRAACDLLLNQAVEALAQAKQKHDALERFYMDAMDYEQLEEIAGDFLASLP